MTIERRRGRRRIQDRDKLQSVKDGTTITRTGTSLVYAGYSWRGRSKVRRLPANAAPDDLLRRDVAK